MFSLISKIALLSLLFNQTLVCNAQSISDSSINDDRKQYHIKEVQSDLSRLLFFQSKTDTVQVGPVIKTKDLKDGMNTIALRQGNRSYLIQLQQKMEFFSITTLDHKLLVTYVDTPYTNKPYGQLGVESYPDYNLKDIGLNVKNRLRKKSTIQFFLTNGKLILTAHLIKKDNNFILYYAKQDEIDYQILDLSAMTILWFEAFSEVNKNKRNH
jgi:hypothetical protein